MLRHQNFVEFGSVVSNYLKRKISTIYFKLFQNIELSKVSIMKSKINQML